MSDTIVRFVGGGTNRIPVYVRVSDVSAFESLPFTEGDGGHRRVLLHMSNGSTIQVRADADTVRQILCSRSGMTYMDVSGREG